MEKGSCRPQLVSPVSCHQLLTPVVPQGNTKCAAFIHRLQMLNHFCSYYSHTHTNTIWPWTLHKLNHCVYVCTMMGERHTFFFSFYWQLQLTELQLGSWRLCFEVFAVFNPSKLLRSNFLKMPFSTANQSSAYITLPLSMLALWLDLPSLSLN